MSDKETCVFVSYSSLSNSNISISISSNTTLTTNMGKRYRIKSWGILSEKHSKYLYFDREYSTDNAYKFVFFLKFPSIPHSTTSISIKENVSNGFYWKGIALDTNVYSDNSGGYSEESQPDTSSNSSSEDSESNRKPNDKDTSNGDEYSEKDNGVLPKSPTIPSSHDSFVVNASGSCFAINKEGFLVTCYHVIEDARRIRIRGINGDFNQPLMAKVFAYDIDNDLAILRMDDSNFSTLEPLPYQIKSKPSEVGEEVFTLGYPLRAVMGDEIKLTNGVVSACSGYKGDITSYQLSATVQSGNSGCPVFNSDGEIIGVVNARLENIESASYAINILKTKSLPSSLVTISYLISETGVRFSSLSASFAAS